MRYVFHRRLLVLAASLSLGALSGVAVAPPAQARAEVSTFTDTHTFTFSGPSDFCLPEDQVGIVTITEVTTAHVVDTGQGVFEVHGVDTFQLQQEFADGSFVQSTKDRDLFIFRVNGIHVVQHIVTLDLRPIYDAVGNEIGKISVHAVSHISSYDLNNDGVPEPGEVKAEFESFRVTCA